MDRRTGLIAPLGSINCEHPATFEVETRLPTPRRFRLTSQMTLLRAIRATTIRRYLRRTIGAILLLGMSGARLEAMFPDVHDDGSRVSSSSVRTAIDDAGDCDTGCSPADSSPTTPPCHSTHVEHCGHSHLLALAFAAHPAPPEASHGLALTQLPPTLESITAPPRQRPPIV